MKLGSADIKKLEELWIYHEELKLKNIIIDNLIIKGYQDKYK